MVLTGVLVKKLTIDASGTLANGLEVSFSDKIDLTNVDKEEGSFDLTLGGAFGSLQFKDGCSISCRCCNGYR
jgi:hypothetical protein